MTWIMNKIDLCVITALFNFPNVFLDKRTSKCSVSQVALQLITQQFKSCLHDIIGGVGSKSREISLFVCLPRDLKQCYDTILLDRTKNTIKLSHTTTWLGVFRPTTMHHDAVKLNTCPLGFNAFNLWNHLNICTDQEQIIANRSHSNGLNW